MSFRTPILVLCYNRPNKLLKLLKIIKKIKPINIYFNCDGPKDYQTDIEKTEHVKNIIENFYSNKNYKKNCNFNKLNLGCKKSVQKGLDFFFKHEEMGIILEDDCIPNLSFFKYCEFLLKKYKYNKKVFAISGFNLTKNRKFGDGDYFLSKYFLCWGWASWRRSWINSDKNLSFFPKWKKNNFLYKFHDDFLEAKYWDKILFKTYKKKIDTWDYHFLASMWAKNSFCILPNYNFIKNIGFDASGTHTRTKFFSQNIKVNQLNKDIKIPSKLLHYKESEEILKNELFKIKYFFYPNRLKYIVKLLISKIYEKSKNISL